MAMGGRSRNNKRSSSSSSYASTITTVAFVAVCVVGVWMLTSNSVAPPQTTTRTGKISTTTTTTTTTDADTSSDLNEVQTTEPVIEKDSASTTTTDADTSDLNEVQTIEPATKKDSAVFEDNPGDLPADAIKTDEPKSNEESENDKKEAGGDGGGAIEEKGTGAEQENSTDDAKGKDLSVEEKQTQTSEKGTMTQNEQPEQVVQESSPDSDGNQEETNQSQDQKISFSDQTSPEYQGTQNPDDQNQQQEQKDPEEIGSNKKPSDHSSVQKQQGNESDQSGGTAGSGQDPENLKSYEAIQQKQRLEDGGVLSNNHSQESSQNDQVPEDDQKNIVQQQQQQQTLLKHQQQQQTKTTAAATTSDQEKSNDVLFPGEGAIPKESKESKKSWSTQAAESENQKERRKDESDGKESIYGYSWQLCNVTAGTDYIPCLDNEKALRQLHSTRHYEHRERHCPEESPTCLVPIPEGYKRAIPWPQSRDKIWYHNVPHTKLAEVKGHQNWVKVTGEFLTFPGGGTQFIHGAPHYIDFVQEAVPNIAWGKRSRVILDVGCGVASFGGFLFDRNVLTMSFAPKDEHEAQVQFALERGIPAISAVMGSHRLPFPSMVFDLVHCARCRVPWHEEGGLLLLELNRVLRPGGHFVWSATPVYQKLQEDVEIWEAMSALTASMCWELVTIKKDKLNSVGAAVYRKRTSNDCYDQRKQNKPPMCKNDDDPNAAWYVPLQACMHRVPVDDAQRGNKWPEEWPSRVQTPPFWLNSSQMGIYGKPSPQDFARDYEHWKHVVSKTYLKNMGISWSNVRNVMDMRAVYGGFAAALKDLQVWVMNVVNVDSPDTLPIIFERGLFGIYHDWCESFSTYPRTYDLLHADHLFSVLRKRCKLLPVIAEIDRIVRPGGKLIVRDESSAIGEVENLLKSLRWEVHLTFSKDQEGLLSAQKGDWRPQTYAASS